MGSFSHISACLVQEIRQVKKIYISCVLCKLLSWCGQVLRVKYIFEILQQDNLRRNTLQKFNLDMAEKMKT